MSNQSEEPVVKMVGFAEPPEELAEHHKDLKRLEEEKKKSSSFHKIPAELQYLNRKDKNYPKPLPVQLHSHQHKKPGKILGDLKKVHVKDIAVINKDTEINFSFSFIELPIPNHNVLVSIKYANLNSWDIGKLNKYYYNLSDTKVGLGHEFVGEVVDVGKNVTDFAKGDYVVGCVSPNGRKGSLSTTLLLNSSKDFMVKLDDITLEKMSSIDPYLKYSPEDAVSDGEEEEPESEVELIDIKTKVESKIKSKANLNMFPVEETLPDLAKASTIPVLYCKAKQALQHLKEDTLPNILIAGADTNLGFTIIQLLTSSLYQFQRLTVVMIIKESNLREMKKWVRYFKRTANCNCDLNLELVTYDLINEDIVLPGEQTPINYKKPDLATADVLEAMFKNAKELINTSNINNYKLDLVIDILGSHFLKKTRIRYKKLDYVNFPAFNNLDDNTSLSKLLHADVKEPLFVKLLKPKASMPGYVSFCKYTLKEPSYSIDKLIDYSTQSSEQSIFNPWSLSWTSGFANSFIKYNYYDELNLVTTREWIIEGLNMFLKQQVKFKIDAYIDWRNHYKDYVKEIRKTDGKVVFKVEDF